MGGAAVPPQLKTEDLCPPFAGISINKVFEKQDGISILDVPEIENTHLVVLRMIELIGENSENLVTASL